MNDKLFQMESNRLKPSEQYLVAAKEVLHELVHATSGIDGVLLASTDGFEVSSIFQKDYDGGKLSAVGSSILALVQALTSEAQLTGCRSVILDAQDGKIMISAVPNQHQPMIVIIVTKQQVLLGQIMHGMNKAINHLTELDQQYNNK
ncbi:roadblock/LC7 domain-containing protein [Psychrobacter frigidicola]|uniref:Roadblock/LC7 domain-containing protein n=1 Tax=Psychrobacter frigidicola TaxID=45611 RepID=A0A5C6ZZH9_9GAMM|nr:roadblock/LC7 domain-containing protein [Psychrobacter frigidicola]TXD96511.1 roadblock/LC7 domain-containing protein [Psychrobacter frigidicola]